MRFNTDRKELAEAAKAVTKFLPRRSADGLAWSNVLLDVTEHAVRLTATDIEAGRTIEVRANVEEPGVAVAAPNLAAVLAGAQGEDIQISTGESNLTVSSDGSMWRLPLGVVDDYPDIGRKADSEPAKVAVEHWARVQAVANISQGVSGKRPILQGVYLEGGMAVATDSYRLAFARFTDDEDHPATLVPSYAIRSLDGQVTAFEVDERMVRADLDDGSWWSRIIEGTYIKWNRLVDDSAPVMSVTAETEVLDEAIRRSTIVGNPDLPLYLRPVAGGGLRLVRKEGGSVIYDETVPASVEDVDVDDFEVAFNPAYLRSMIAPVTEVRIGLEDPFKPARISGDGWWQGFCMPVRV